MSSWASGAWAPGAWAGTAWAEGEPVEVPNVVGFLEADAIAAIVNAGFTAEVASAASSTVPVGVVISQAPTGGTLATAGSTVTIVVSTGDVAPVDPLDAKFQRRNKNVKFKPNKRQPAPAEIVQPEITNVPHMEPAPARKGALLGMLDLLPEPVPAVAPAPEPEKKLEILPKKEAPTPEKKLETLPKKEAVSPPPSAPTPTPAPTIDITPMLEGQAALAKQVSALAAQLTATQEALAQLTALQTNVVVRAQEATAAVDTAVSRRERNRKKAEEIAAKLLLGE